MATGTRLTGVVFILQVVFICLIYVMLFSQPASISFSRYSAISGSNSQYFLPNTTNTATGLVVVFNDTKTTEESDTETRTEARYNSTTVVETDKETLWSNNKPVTFLLIMVSVQPEEFDARQCIRNTWYRGFNDSEGVMMRFAIGTKGVTSPSVPSLQDENDTYGDIAFLGDIKDHSKTSTNKTLSMFIWAHENVNFTYLMKSEQTTFIYVKNMIEELEKRPKHTRLYYGRIQFKKRPIRRNSEWADPHWDLASTYLPFALGGGYVLTSDLITLLILRRRYLAYHPNEDTAIASWICAYRYERRNDNLMCVTPFGRSKTLEGKCESKIIARLCYGLTGKDMQKWFRILYESTVNS